MFTVVARERKGFWSVCKGSFNLWVVEKHGRTRNMAHVLVVGGTGILEKVSLFLASHGNVVTVVARSQQDFEKLQAQAIGLSGKINPIVVDYQEMDGLSRHIQNSIAIYGPVTLAVNWVQEQFMKVVDVIATLINATSPLCRYFQVLSGSELTGSRERNYFENAFRNLERVLYRIIVLGFTRSEQGARRQLNNEEISEGIIKALRDDSKKVLIGSDPWEEVLDTE
jgi:NAD(P)-dependent dehydrogenase (short-subunit alcohol dehydrogenase family)